MKHIKHAVLPAGKKLRESENRIQELLDYYYPPKKQKSNEVIEKELEQAKKLFSGDVSEEEWYRIYNELYPENTILSDEERRAKFNWSSLTRSKKWLLHIHDEEYHKSQERIDFITNILSEKTPKGNILEAMCGGSTYIKSTSEKTITGLDVCEEYLFYQYPSDRRRIWCDLNSLSSENPGKIMSLRDEEFSSIVECYGYKYPKDIVATFREFHRILSRNSSLLMIENTNSGFGGYRYSDFNRDEMRGELLMNLNQAGFKESTITPISEDGIISEYPFLFLIEARKI